MAPGARPLQDHCFYLFRCQVPSETHPRVKEHRGKQGASRLQKQWAVAEPWSPRLLGAEPQARDVRLPQPCPAASLHVGVRRPTLCPPSVWTGASGEAEGLPSVQGLLSQAQCVSFPEGPRLEPRGTPAVHPGVPAPLPLGCLGAPACSSCIWGAEAAGRMSDPAGLEGFAFYLFIYFLGIGD